MSHADLSILGISPHEFYGTTPPRDEDMPPVTLDANVATVPALPIQRYTHLYPLDMSPPRSSEASSELSSEPEYYVPNPKWTLYDSREAEDFADREQEWHHAREDELEQLYNVDLRSCHTVTHMLQHVTGALRVRYATAEAKYKAALCLHAKTHSYVDYVKDEGGNFEGGLDNLRQLSRQLVSVVEQVLEAAVADRDDIKGSMFTLQRHINNLASATQTPACCICLSDPIERVVVPCGHVYCIACSSRMMQQMPHQCYTCRGPVSSLQRLCIS